MKRLLIIGVIVLDLAGCSAIPRQDRSVVQTIDDLKSRIGGTVVVVGRYHDPGKGERWLDCGFVTLTIGGDSLYSRKPNGELVAEVMEGEEIEIRARLRYFAGSRVPIEEEKLVQTASDGTEALDGHTFSIHSPRYIIEHVTVIRRRERE